MTTTNKILLWLVILAMTGALYAPVIRFLIGTFGRLGQL